MRIVRRFVEPPQGEGALVRALADVAQDARTQRANPQNNLIAYAVRRSLMTDDGSQMLSHVLNAGLQSDPRATIDAIKKKLSLINSYVISSRAGQALQVFEERHSQGNRIHIVLFPSEDGLVASNGWPIEEGITANTNERSLEEYLSPLESEAAKKIASSLLQSTDLDAVVDLIPDSSPLRIAAILYHLYQMARDGKISHERMVELGARLLGVEIARFTTVALVFAIPGIGPAAASLLIARALNRMS